MTKQHILENIGNTPMISLHLSENYLINVFAKIEGYNPTGSVKDRAAAYILKTLLNEKLIDENTVIIESTSGNFGVALAAYCQYYGLKFIAVIDPLIAVMNETLIRAQGAQIVKVTQPDKFGGYLLSRIKKIQELKNELPNTYWINQYENPLNVQAYYQSLGQEICDEIKKIDYVFIGVSSGGTITGISKKVKEQFPNAKIIAVDVEGSMIFTGCSKKRFIPGVGSSMVPKILTQAIIDDVVLTDEIATIEACQYLLEKHNLFVGGSSGTVFAGIRKYFSNKPVCSPVNIVTVFPDRGERYFNTIYNDEWRLQVIKYKTNEMLAQPEI